MEIREARIKKGLTQQQLANKMGVTVTTVSRWETGRSKPKMYDLKRLWRILKVLD